MIREGEANTQVFLAGETLMPVPVTLNAVATQQANAENTRDAVRCQRYSYQMAGQAQFNQDKENDALAFAFEAISNEHQLPDVQAIFYDIAGTSHERMT